jgi:hypothetical protein
VKPSPDADPSVAAAYKVSCDALAAAAAANLDTRRVINTLGLASSRRRMVFPAGGHMGIHRMQIARSVRLP